MLLIVGFYPLIGIAQMHTTAVKLGYEVINYKESFITEEGFSGNLTGQPGAIVLQASHSVDVQPLFGIPAFLSLDVTTPLSVVPSYEYGTFAKEGATFTSQRTDVTHYFTEWQFLAGYRASEWVQPFVSLSFSNFRTNRANLMEGTEEGIFKPNDEVRDWDEIIRSTHVGVGFQGAYAFLAALTARYRFGASLPITVGAENTHPTLNPISRGDLGNATTGVSTTASVVLAYPVATTLRLLFGADWYYRIWNGDGEKAYSDGGAEITWPRNVMHAIPISLGLAVSY